METKIQKIYVENFKPITEQEINLDGCSVIVYGGNNKGKSSLLYGIIQRLTGKKPSIITNINSDKENGIYELTLTSGEKFIWKFKKDGSERLEFITKEGYKTPVTKSIIEKFINDTFDIKKFINSTPNEQMKIIKKIFNINTDDIDKEYNKLYEERRSLKKEIATIETLSSDFDPKLPEKTYDISIYETELKTFENIKNKKETNKKLISQLEIQEKDLENNINDIKKQIEELTKKLNETTEKLKNIRDTKLKLESATDSLNYDTNRITELENKIKEYSNLNTRIIINNSKRETIKKIQESNKRLLDIQSRMDVLLENKKQLISNSNIPKDITFSDEGLLYKGLPVTEEQLSKSGLYKISISIAMSTLKELKAVYLDASDLDKNTLNEVYKWANENDLQLLIEKVDDEGGEIRYEIINKTKKL